MTSSESPTSPPSPLSPPSPPLRADARRNRARILESAAAVFAEKGASATTEEVAVRAGVAVGTVFRHFPTKNDLLKAILKDLMEHLAERVRALGSGDPATGLFAFFGEMVGQAVEKRTVAELAAADFGVDTMVAGPVETLRDAIGTLLARAQAAGAVRADVRPDEVLALLTGVCQGAVHAAWPPDLQRRVLAIVFAGLRP
ncbi:putative transcriptional regulatory protein TetR [Sphaerisporangium krabiense]|uniref:AcrR family transcriptional regulator n=1 Tax=Sphaerisporangium krabiense TaxID=763782 RepID=A0A7W9DTH6_9ACTN|nr:TetR/AcrR family transcriptional regulator [Sphaerisporangium krabiense]MBB5630636.1 AcrR family transcriptional regulator [Sphaerisporangium krabiense]GII62408.1 putative transcriptional regulatory protein TetR [Sphaerisporangium krabiense]